jgi:hypothetical protein
MKITEVGSASFFGGALSAGPLPFFLRALALVRCRFKFANALFRYSGSFRYALSYT